MMDRCKHGVHGEDCWYCYPMDKMTDAEHYTLSLPSDEQIINKADEIFEKNGDENEYAVFLAACAWVRSQIKTAQPVSDDELRKLAIEYCSPSLDIIKQIFYCNGFRAAEKFHGIKETK